MNFGDTLKPEVFLKGFFRSKIDDKGIKKMFFKVTGVATLDKRFNKLHMTSHHEISEGKVFVVHPGKSKLSEYFCVDKYGKIVAQLSKSRFKHGWWRYLKVG